MNTSPALSITISKKEILEFYDSFLLYKGEKYDYRDFDGISYLYTRTNHRIYYIPVGTSHRYNISFRVKGKSHTINFSSESNFDMFAKICNAFEATVKKYILINLLIEYGEKGGLDIADIKINSQGLFIKKLFGMSVLPWEEFYNCVTEAGYTHVLKIAKNKDGYKEFATPSMSRTNALLLPDLLNFLFKFNGILSAKDVEDLKTAKKEVNEEMMGNTLEVKKCENCNEPISDDSQKFCGSCGAMVNM